MKPAPTTSALARLSPPAPLTAALTILGLAAAVAAVRTTGPWILALWLLPDLALLAGWDREMSTQGRLAPRAVPAYNTLHALPGPAVAIGAGVLASSSLLLAGGLVWISHVLADRALGYGLRNRDGWQRV